MLDAGCCWMLPAQGAFDTEILKVLGFYAEQCDSILGEVRCMRAASSAATGKQLSLQLASGSGRPRRQRSSV
jgi:hypothetical protein